MAQNSLTAGRFIPHNEYNKIKQDKTQITVPDGVVRMTIIHTHEYDEPALSSVNWIDRTATDDLGPRYVESRWCDLRIKTACTQNVSQ